MEELIFATGNKHKVKEVAQLLDGILNVKSMKEIGCVEDIPETSDSFQGNALLKAKYIVDNYNVDSFAEDSGLEVKALDGAPGIYSARFAGEGKNDEDNIDKVLSSLKGIQDRSAQFRSVIALCWKGETYYFEGIIEGQITEQRQGTNGFGYDPIFIPNEKQKSFAEMLDSEKNQLSHRGKAIAQLVDFFREQKIVIS